jgi:CBS domain-containing protein
MTVKDILSRKGNEAVTIEPTASIAAAAQLLAERRIGAVIVTSPSGEVVGILSERDIVRILAAKGSEALGLSVENSMTRRVVSCTESDTAATLMERMTTGKFRHIPVLRENRLVGVVSIGDIVKNRLEEIERETDAMRDYIATA